MGSKEYFDQVATRWDEMRHCLFSDAVRDKAISVAGVQPGKVAADIGAGTGYITEGLVEKGVSVIAVDQSEEMLSEMARRLAHARDIDYRVGDGENLPIEDGALDYAFANMYLHHVETPSRAIKEMARALGPGGKLVITDMDKHEHEFLRHEHHDRWLGFERGHVRRWFTDAGLSNVVVDSADET